MSDGLSKEKRAELCQHYLDNAYDKEIVYTFLCKITADGYVIHKGDCKGFLERYIEMDAQGSPHGPEIPKAGRYGT